MSKVCEYLGVFVTMFLFTKLYKTKHGLIPGGSIKRSDQIEDVAARERALK